jgi:ABC-2 type transport system ATP-binding protein
MAMVRRKVAAILVRAARRARAQPAANSRGSPDVCTLQPTVLTLTGVTRRYGGHVAVAGLSLQVRPGEVFGLLGPNGAGKTTTVHMAVGLLAPDAGEVRIGARGAPTDPAVRRHIGVAPQSLALYDDLTGAENLAFLARIHGLTGAERERAVEAALAFVGLSDRRRDRTSAYSGGMKRRLNLAAAVLHDPELILLDEPTAGVDPQSRNAIFENITALRARGRTVVYTTHYMEEAERLCDRVAVMDHGRILALDTVPQLIREHGGTPVLVAEVDGGERRLPAPDPLRALNELAAAGSLGGFHVERPTLEQVFLRLTGRQLRD